MLVAEAYKEVTKFVLQDLDEESSLYKAIQTAFRGGDFPKDSLIKMTNNEESKYQRLVANYAAMYVDAFVATS